MPASEAKKRWMKENTVVMTVKFNKRTEQDMLDYLSNKAPATEFKKGIRLLMEQETKLTDL